MKKYLISGFALIAVLIVFFGYRTYSKSQTPVELQFQTVDVVKDTLINMVGGTGTVRAEQTAMLVWQTSGQIDNIYVESGDFVQKEQLLADLDILSLPQSVINARAEVIEARRALENLNESELEMKKAYQAYIAAQKELEDAVENRDSKDYQRASDATIDEARANYLMAVDAVEDAEEDFNNVSHLYEEEKERVVALANLAAARKTRDDQEANLNYLLGLPDELEISEADARVEVARANLEDTEREWLRLKDGVDPEDIAAAQARLASVESTSNMAELKAPFDGIVTDVSSMEGDKVSASTISFRIDDLSQSLIDMDISEMDINRVKIGQKVDITFDAILNKEYNGVVVKTAPVGTTVQGIVNFPVTIKLMDGDTAVMPGMTAAVNIITTRLEDVLVVPNRALRGTNGNRVLFLLKEGQQEMVPVEMGETSESYSEITSGDVKEGDVVILNPVLETEIPAQ